MKIVAILFFAMLSITCFADSSEPLIEIYRSEKATPLGGLFGNRVQKKQPIQKRFQPKTHSNFPVKSNKWYEEKFTRKAIDDSKIIPLFIVGCTQNSENWLKRRKKELMAVKAIGIIVECESKEKHNRLVRAATPLPAFISNADGLELYLNHNIYPVYIHQKGIEQ